MSHPEIVKWRKDYAAHEEASRLERVLLDAPRFPSFELEDLLDMSMDRLEEIYRLSSSQSQISQAILIQTAYVVRVATARERD